MTTWTKEPPKEPGWYWVQHLKYDEFWTISMAYVRKTTDKEKLRATQTNYKITDLQFRRFSSGGSWRNVSANEYTLWWPIPITPPIEEKP